MFGMPSIKEVDPHTVQRMQAEGEVVLVDVRTEAEFAAGAIPGAKFMPLHLLPLAGEQLPKDKPVVFYCRSGARSAQACLFMANKGYDQVYNLAGGIINWARAGLALAAA
ncbi:rhodanese-like domain-containing protein [Thiobacter aerophilum]|uniref:Rhodanese-like domain-containing protein n=1 Tax=Thiobacter aerophilum TaxID=3121275 RepID=A0ABV0EIS7_9BURK